MMYTKDDYKIEIRLLTHGKCYDPVYIANSTYQIYRNNISELDQDFLEKLLDIANMEMGPEFEMSEEEFMKFIDNM